MYQVEEEQNLISELRKIEARKKERDKKTQDLQKLITAADSQADPRKQERKVPRKKLQHQTRPRIDTNVIQTYFRMLTIVNINRIIVSMKVIIMSFLEEYPILRELTN